MTPRSDKCNYDTVREYSGPDRRLLSKQLEILSQHIGSTLLGATASIIFIFYVMMDAGVTAPILAWVVVALGLIGLRLFLHIIYKRKTRNGLLPEWLTPYWIKSHYVTTFLSGCTWAWAGVAFLPEQHLQLAIMIIVFGGASAATIATYASIRGLSATFTIPTMVPFSINIISQANDLYLMTGIIMLVFMVILVVAGERQHQALIESLRLSLENLDIARQAETARTKTEQLNRELHLEVETRRMAENSLETTAADLVRILDNMQDTYYATDLDGKITRASASVKSLLGYTPEEIHGLKISNFYYHPKDRDEFIATLKRHNGKVQNYCAPFRRKDNTVVWVSTNAQFTTDRDGNIQGVEGTTRDITAIKEAERALFQEKEKAQVTLSSIGDGVITLDTNGNIDYMNPVAEHFTGWDLDEAKGKPIATVVRLKNKHNPNILGNLASFRAIHQQPVLFDDDLVLENRFRESEYSVEINLSDLRDEENNCQGSVMILHDVTRLRGMAQEMSYQAKHDSLTGLINRAEFERHLNIAINEAAEASGTQHALMYLDLDQFKVVNDTCGHIAGDELLKQLTYELRSRIRGDDILARLGGDEFGVLLRNCEINKAEAVAEDLRDIAQRFRFVWEEKIFEIGVSIGLASINADSGDLASLLSAADSACYVAKDMGRNRVHIFHNNDEAVAQRHGQMQWIQRIKQALEENRIALHCQQVHPIDKAGGHGYYREILMRLIDEDGELVSPAVFIPAAERYNLMPSIDRWVVETTLRYFGEADKLAENDIIAINLSGQSFTDDKFLDFISEKLHSSGFNPKQLCLEITETAAISNQSRASEFIAALKKKGCLFALDDFGSGLSSFGYLKRMPVDFLKIDGVFIRDINDDPVHYAMVESINHIGHVFGMMTIAEFVENDEILNALQEMGVDYAQGFGVARPEPLIDYVKTEKLQFASA